MRKIIGIKSLVLTCCAVGVLTTTSQAWAVDNCTQITAQNEADVDSTPNSATGATDAETLTNLLTNNPTDGSNDANQTYDDEDCAALTVNIIHDFGDAPESYGTVLSPTNPADPVAAQHEIVSWLKLGTLTDDETNGVPTATADGDDADTVDEDGVSIPSMTAGQTAPVITIPAPTNTSGADAYVACWIDYDSSGTFDAGEFGSAVVPNGNAGDITITMPDVPAGVPTTDAIDTGIDSYARCRLSNVELTATDAAGVITDSTGIADGEVEDYPVDFTPEAVFDLALVKALADGQATDVNVGDTVTFTITVTNQGGVDATGIIITDYIPTGMTLVAGNGWTDNGDGTATLDAANAIDLPVATGSATVNISFTIDNDAAGDLVNTAEISVADGGNDINGDPREDVDSTPDTTANNDTIKDGVITEDGKADPANDEDDHDVAQIHVNQVDLELGKRVLNKNGDAEITAANRGDTVIYELSVTNNGPDTATGIVVQDMLPAGVTFVSTNAATPSTYDAVNGLWTVGSDLANGATVTLQITVTID